MENPLSLENLFRQAFKRTKERFLSYLIVALISIGIGIAVVIGLLLIIGLLALLFALTKSIILITLLSLLFLLAALTLMYYVGAWLHLTTTYVIISPKKVTTGEAFAKMKPLVWNYVKLEVLLSLFFLGLVIPTLFTLFIALLIWAFWGTFVTFVYLEQQKKGLDNLWTSKAIVSQKFWGVTGRLILVMILIWLLQIAFNSGGKNSIGPFFSFIISLLSGPFVLSYHYEIYKNLPLPQNIPTPKGWIIASLLGLILTFGALVFGLVKLFETFSLNQLSTIMETLPKTLPKDLNFPFLTPTPKPNFYQELPGAI